jgi:hypothetical protein
MLQKAQDQLAEKLRRGDGNNPTMLYILPIVALIAQNVPAATRTVAFELATPLVEGKVGPRRWTWKRQPK